MSRTTRWTPAPLRRQVQAVMEAHWRPDGRGGGHTVPNADVYPHQWLWDSCFHALIWAELGEPDRAIAELSAALADQADDGFVPHVRYVADPYGLAGFWGRTGTSSITQPPMYGHVVAELRRRGVSTCRPRWWSGPRPGVRFLLDPRARTADGLVTVVHPWETGCDDSPRWDSWCDDDWTATRWYEVKGELLATVERSACGSPVANPAFAVAPAGFNALVAFNARELGLVDECRRAWPRRSRPAGRPTCGRGSTATTGRPVCGRVDALLPLLVTTVDHGDGGRRPARRPRLRWPVRAAGGAPRRAGLRPRGLLAGLGLAPAHLPARPGRGCRWASTWSGAPRVRPGRALAPGHGEGARRDPAVLGGAGAARLARRAG